MVNAGYTTDDFSDLLTWSLISAIIGGRLFFFLFWSPESFLSDPLEFFRVWHGGMSITGCVIIGTLGAFICTRIKKWIFFDIANLAAAPLIFGMAIGRVGCFLNGDAYGIPTTLPWGVILHPQSIGGFAAAQWAAVLGRPVKLHPTQLYEVIGDLVILAVILARNKKSEFIRRNAFILAVGGYGIVRFLNEFLRGDAVPSINLHPHRVFSAIPGEFYPLFDRIPGSGHLVWHFLSGGQLVSLLMILFALIFLFIPKTQKIGIRVHNSDV